jgi:hypothetical protein
MMLRNVFLTGVLLLSGSVARAQSDAVDDTPGARIVAVAVAQEGCSVSEVGQDLKKRRDTLERYVKPGAPWCSEFVSWAYKTAGYPFTNGSPDPWMLTSSTRIKEWFIREETFIPRGSLKWRKLEPRAGDYIRFENGHGGHSAIVRGVAGADLDLVEGNGSGKRVTLRTVTNWRDRDDIDGIGQRDLRLRGKKRDKGPQRW